MSTTILPLTITPIGFVTNSRTTPVDDGWDEIISEITLSDHLPVESLAGISQFSHLEVIYFFDQVKPEDVVLAGRPRGNPHYPLMGIFAQRKKDRPNRLGLCTVELLEQRGRVLKVKNLDAIHGTPVLDIKPVFREFLPKGNIRQPAWVSDLMTHYWTKG
jgi:tRNA (adenine37-N6)-methyltransferase